MRALLAWSGLSYRELHRRVVRSRRGRGTAELPSYDTVYRCLRPGRSRLDVELVVDIARELRPGADTAHQWRRAHQVVTGLASEASVVDVWAGLPDDRRFTGRSAVVAAMLAELAGPGPKVIAVDGMPGVGKTTLAARVALLAGYAEPFTADLRGFDPDRPPADPAAVLDGLLHRLAPAGSRVPHTIEDKTGRLRDLTARRPVLLLLDNAASPEQVRPLLPMADGTVVLVTSRQRLDLPGMAITLDVLDAEESIELLHRSTSQSTSPSTGTAAPELAQLADLAGHLPLALAMIAGRIRDHPDWALADHVERLRERRRLLRLDGGIELVLRTAYERLAPPHRAMLRRLSLPRGLDFDEYAGAALAGCDPATARALMGDLHRTNLLQQRQPGRYRLHDILRVFAGARTIDEDSARERRAALTRLHDLLLAAAAQAMDVIAPHERDQRPRIRPVGELPAMADAEAATGWLDAERANLVAAAIASPRPRFAPLLSQTIARYLALNAHEHDAETLHLAAARVAEGTELGRVLLSLGAVYWRRGHYEPASERFRQALARSDEPAVQCRAYMNLSLVQSALGQYAAALREQHLALRASQLAADRTIEARILNNLGFLASRLDRPGEALSYFGQAVELARLVGDHSLTGQATGNAGYIHYQQGNYEQALAHTRVHLDCALESGHRGAEGDARSQLGLIHAALGDRAAAITEHTAALRLFTDIGWQQKQAEALNDFGITLARLGDHAAALDRHRAALAIADELGVSHERSRAEAGIAAAGRAGTPAPATSG
ncbi:MAG TPA: tetratricopeptide repeat protein [Pseudonocardiaceae bacterium]|nr:tetratricopeptide repeat protein [Pseudonocardiaceae bacterium]